MHMKFNFYAGAAFLFLALSARAQTTAFTYQGQLNSSNAPATGSYDFRFQIYNANNSVVAGPLTNAPVGVTNGLFTVTLDFGASIFNGSTRSLEIGVRGYGDTNAYAVLSPRQTLTSVPYAIQAINASNAVALTAPLPATNMTGIIPNALLSPNVAILTNNVIFSGNVTATNFTGAGHGLTNVPGAFFWVVVSGTNVQAQPNVGYICTNDVIPVTIALPPSAALSVGDTFRVAGVGGAGWVIAQTNGQTIFTGNLGDAAGQNWKSNGLFAYWSAVASSASGTKLVATCNGGDIFATTNSGATWSTNATPQIWSSVASSADGTRLVATVGGKGTTQLGQIYTSTNSGVNWTPYGSTTNWVSVASSADGSRLVAAVYAGYLYTSVNYGTNWTARANDTPRLWTAVASSSDGSKLVAAGNGGYIYTSTNFGTNWTAQTGSGSPNWSAVASSSDGSRLVAAVGNGSSGSIYISADSGATWTPNTTISGQWSSVASSSDGSHLAAVYNVTSPGYIYTSSDSGTTWSQRTDAPNADWAGVAMSADGSQIVAVPDGGFVYISSLASTSTGTNGYVRGAQHTALELEYVSTNLFLPLSHEGAIRAY
jgi:hypothetical protein